MKARLKTKDEIEVIQHVGPNTIAVIGKKGEQRAQPGDYIVIYPFDETKVPDMDKTLHRGQYDREVMSAKDFHDKYELLDDDGNVIDGKHTAGEAYGVPQFDTVDQAQAAAQTHYAGKTTENVAQPVSEVFKCTIGTTDHLYAVQPSGMVAEIPVAKRNPASDFGYGTSQGYQSDVYPQSIAKQGAAVHDAVGPVSPFQRGSASEETPASTFGQVQNAPQGSAEYPNEHLAEGNQPEVEPTEENTRPEGYVAEGGNARKVDVNGSELPEYEGERPVDDNGAGSTYGTQEASEWQK